MISTHFVLRLGLGAILTLVAVLSAFPLQRAYPDHPQLGLLVIALAALTMVRSANATPQALLSKELDFGRLAILDILSSLTAFFVAVPMEDAPPRDPSDEC